VARWAASAACLRQLLLLLLPAAAVAAAGGGCRQMLLLLAAAAAGYGWCLHLLPAADHPGARCPSCTGTQLVQQVPVSIQSTRLNEHKHSSQLRCYLKLCLMHLHACKSMDRCMCSVLMWQVILWHAGHNELASYIASGMYTTTQHLPHTISHCNPTDAKKHSPARLCMMLAVCLC
jgi:hypothetical protein